MDFLSLELVNSLGIIGALCVASFQTWRAARDARKRDEDHRTERALDLYRDLVVEGDTAAAFHRLSLELRRRGSRTHGGTTWMLLSDADFAEGGVLDPGLPESDSPFEDLYRVLWFFERVHTSLDHHLVDRDVLMRTIGFHIWWWSQLLINVSTPKATRSLRYLAPLAEEWARSAGEHSTWVDRCRTDFAGEGPCSFRTRQPPIAR